MASNLHQERAIFGNIISHFMRQLLPHEMSLEGKVDELTLFCENFLLTGKNFELNKTFKGSTLQCIIIRYDLYCQYMRSHTTIAPDKAATMNHK